MPVKPLSVRIRNWSATIVAIAVIAVPVHNYFQTDAEAAEHEAQVASYQQQRLTVDKYNRLDEVKDKISKIDYALLSEDLSEKQVKYLTNQRRDLEAQKICINEDKC